MISSKVVHVMVVAGNASLSSIVVVFVFVVVMLVVFVLAVGFIFGLAVVARICWKYELPWERTQEWRS